MKKTMTKTMAKKRIYATRNIPGLGEWAKTNGQFTVEYNQEERNLTYSELMKEAKNSDALITMLSDNVDKDFFEANQHLQVISNYAVGTNNIFISEATRLGIPIGNTPNVLTETTADLALTLLLNVTRRVPYVWAQVRKGNWTSWEPSLFNGMDMRKKTVGLIGFGRIGQAFAQKLWHLWKCPIVVWPRESAKRLELDFPFCVVEEKEFFELCDVVSLHCPLTSDTEGIINKDFIEKMKKPFVFINTARGACHREDDLLLGLKENKIVAVGLDVSEPEPMSKNSPLLKKENVMVLPHIGSATKETREEMTRMCLENVVAGLNQRPLPYSVFDPFKTT